MGNFRSYLSTNSLLQFFAYRWMGLLVAILVWLFDTFAHVYGLHGHEEPLFESLFPSDTNELYMRLVTFTLIVIFGAYVQVSNQRIKKASSDLQRMLESTTDAYLELGYDGEITYINERASNILQVTRPDVIGQNVWDVFPEAADDFYKQVQKIIDDRQPMEFTRLYSAIGRWLDVHAYPFDNYVTFYFRDITEQILLLESNRRLNTIIGSASDGILTINQSGVIETFNEAAEVMFGYKHDEIIGKNITTLMGHDNDVIHHDKYIHNFLLTGESRIIGVGPREVMAKRKDGSSFPMDLAISDMRFGDQCYFIGIVRDITDRQENRNKLEYLSNYDTLTALPNRSLFSDRLSQSLKLAKREGNIVSLMFIDLDNFKQVNDTLGHAAGDELLINVAEKLSKCVRDSDTVARLGGDEFAVILCQGHNKNDVTRVLEKILSEFNEPFEIGGKQFTVTASIGISQFPKDAITEEQLLHCADMAMYKVKQAGRNAYVFYESEMS